MHPLDYIDTHISMVWTTRKIMLWGEQRVPTQLEATPSEGQGYMLYVYACGYGNAYMQAALLKHIGKPNRAGLWNKQYHVSTANRINDMYLWWKTGANLVSKFDWFEWRNFYIITSWFMSGVREPYGVERIIYIPYRGLPDD